MRKLKKILASLMALGMVSSMGISAFADTTEDTKKTFYTGDVNLDGKVNVLDLLSLKKMVLGIIPLEKMYIDGDALKLVEDTPSKVEEVTIQATECTVDVENNTIHVTGIGDTLQVHDLTLKVTDNTTFSGNFSNLEEVAKKLEDIKGLCIDITYNSLTKEISHVAQISVFPSTVETIQTCEYTVDVENNLINVKMSTDEYLPIKVTEDTVFDSDIVNLEGLSKLELEGDMYGKAISITYHNNTLEAIEVNRILDIVEPITYTTMSSKDDYDINIDTENMKVSIAGTGDNSNFSDVLNITIDTEITRNDETLTLEELSQITDYQYILIYVEYNPDNKEVTKISLADINSVEVEKDIQTIEVGLNTYYDIIGVYDTNKLRIAIDGGNDTFIVTDDTIYRGTISSLSDIQYPDWYLSISYYVNEDGEYIVTEIYGNQAQVLY